MARSGRAPSRKYRRKSVAEYLFESLVLIVQTLFEVLNKYNVTKQRVKNKKLGIPRRQIDRQTAGEVDSESQSLRNKDETKAKSPTSSDIEGYN